MSEFTETKKLFNSVINYTNPLSYEEWCAVPDEYKAAALYLQFFDQITLAWVKSRSFYASEEEGVETVLQYLCKNVPIILANKNKFTARYIYRVSYNCLYCISHDRKIDKDRFEFEISNICSADDGTELDLFDTVKHIDDFDSGLVEDRARSMFWAKIEDLGESTQDLIDLLLEKGKVPSDLSASNRQLLAALREALVDFA